MAREWTQKHIEELIEQRLRRYGGSDNLIRIDGYEKIWCKNLIGEYEQYPIDLVACPDAIIKTIDKLGRTQYSLTVSISGSLPDDFNPSDYFSLKFIPNDYRPNVPFMPAFIGASSLWEIGRKFFTTLNGKTVSISPYKLDVEYSAPYEGCSTIGHSTVTGYYHNPVLAEPHESAYGIWMFDNNWQLLTREDLTSVTPIVLKTIIDDPEDV